MERYNEYKDSGVQWLGEIPSHWETRPLKYSCSLKGRIGWNGLRSEEFQDTAFAYLVTGQDFIGSEIDWSKCYQISRERYDEDPFIQLNNGDMLITKDGTIGKVAKVTNLDKPACLNSGIFVIKQKGSFFNQGFLYWMLCSNVLKEFNVYTQTGATIAHLYQNVFENMPCLLPPISEQQAIATYLDTVTSKIDEAIAQQQKMIDLLNERKQIIINNAVTKGLNPDAPMKDSGVEWIGKIPEHWEVMKTSHIFHHIGSGTTPKSGREDYYSEDAIPFLQTGDLNDGFINETSKHITEKALRDTNLKLYPKGSLVVAMYGATIGKLGILNIDTTVNQACCVLPTSDRVGNKFAMHVLSTAKADLLLKSRGGGQPNISQDTIRNVKIVVPPLAEQNEIVQYIEHSCTPIDGAISNATKQISLLQERKQIIINDVVTGKVKVL